MSTLFQNLQRLRSLLLLAMLLPTTLGFLCGCTLLTPLPNNTTREPGLGACEKNSDCLKGQTCFLQYCKSQGNSDQEKVSLQLVPSNNHNFNDPKTTITKQQFVGIVPSKIHNRTIQARIAFTVRGEVRWFDKKEQKHVPAPAKIRFIDRESIAGQRLAWEVATDPRQTSNARFQHRLSYGTYTVEIWPRHLKWPPYRTKILVDGHKTQNLELPPASEYPHIKGRLLSSSSPPTPMAGLKVQLLSKEGLPISKVFSTNEQGNFDIWTSKGTVPHTLRIQQKSTAPLHPQLDIPYPKKQPLKSGENVELGDIPVCLSSRSLQISGQVRARLQDGGHHSPYTHIRIIGEIDTGTYQNKNLRGSFVANVRSDNSGNYKAILPPGKYHFEVIPPANSDRSRAYVVPTQSYFHSNRTIDLELSPKRRIVGKVCEKAEDGTCKKKLPHAQIQALWRSPLPQSQQRLTVPQITSQPTTPFSTEISKSDGSYELNLDPGYYDFVYVPPNASGLARFIRTNVKINNNEMEPYVKLDGFLPKANHLVGQILDTSRFPIANLTVEMYSHSRTGETARLLGRAVTNSQGFFSIPYHTAKP